MHYLFLAMLLAYLGGNGYIFWRLWPLVSGWPVALRWGFSLLYWGAATALFFAMALRHHLAGSSLMPLLFGVGSLWMVFTLYMVLALGVVDLLRLWGVVSRFGALYALGATILLLLYGHWNYLHPRIEALDISLDKPLDEELTIVMLSDVHLGHGTGRQRLSSYVEMIMEQRPDLILIAGDLIDNAVEPLLEQQMAELLQRLEAPLGIYMVPGNHEYISGILPSEHFLKQTPIRLLRDEVLRFENGVQLIGRDDRTNRHRASLDSLVARCDTLGPILLMDHQPYELHRGDSLRVDLQLYGHTHRGQVWPLNWLTDYLYEQSHGYRRWPYGHVYVSSGLSLWGPPVRIGTHSDMALIHLKGQRR